MILPKEPKVERSLSDAERLDEIEGKLLLVAQTTDSNTSVMLGGMQVMDTRLAMLFLILEDMSQVLPASAVKKREDHPDKIDLDHYEKCANWALAAGDPKSEPEPEVAEPATDAEEVAVFFGGKP